MYDTHSMMSTAAISSSTKNDVVRKAPKPSLSFGRGRKGMGAIYKSFSFSLKKSQRSLTPMRRSQSTLSNDSGRSVSSTEMEQVSKELTPKQVRFSNNPNSKKVRVEIISFPKTTEQEAPLYWYNQEDMMNMMEDVKHTMKEYLKKCDRYCTAMNKMATKCSQADSSEEAITRMLEPKVLLQIADAAARGVEHLITPRQMFTREQVCKKVLSMQECSQSEANAQAIATRYRSLSKTARLMAKTMGDGDAMVADNILKRSPRV